MTEEDFADQMENTGFMVSYRLSDIANQVLWGHYAAVGKKMPEGRQILAAVSEDAFMSEGGARYRRAKFYLRMTGDVVEGEVPSPGYTGSSNIDTKGAILEVIEKFMALAIFTGDGHMPLEKIRFADRGGPMSVSFYENRGAE